MQTNDTVLFKSVFADQVTMATVAKTARVNLLERETGIAGFLKAIAKPNQKARLTKRSGI